MHVRIVTGTNFALRSSLHITLSRRVIPADVRKQKLDVMPGYRVSWHYSGIEVEPEARYYNNTPGTMAFIRYYSIHIKIMF